MGASASTGRRESLVRRIRQRKNRTPTSPPVQQAREQREHHYKTLLCHECSAQFFINEDTSNCPRCHGGFVEVNQINRSFHQLLVASRVAQNVAASNTGLDSEELLFNMAFFGETMRTRSLQAAVDEALYHSFDNLPIKSSPTCKNQIQKLESSVLTASHIDEFSECVICRESFVCGETATFLPCKHFFHKDCVQHWLEVQHFCCICRYELVSESKDAERKEEVVLLNQNHHSESRRNLISVSRGPIGSLVERLDRNNRQDSDGFPAPLIDDCPLPQSSSKIRELRQEAFDEVEIEEMESNCQKHQSEISEIETDTREDGGESWLAEDGHHITNS